MAKNKFMQTILAPTVCLFICCLVATGLLAVTNKFTSEKIEANLREEANRLYVIVVPEAETFREEKVEVQGETFVYQVGLKGDETVGYVFNTQKNGYGGPIVVLTGLDSAGVIKGVQILSMTETAGLGMNAGEPAYLNQYKNKSKHLTVVKTDPGEDQIQAISAATITSQAVTDAVNQALEIFEAQKGGQ